MLSHPILSFPSIPSFLSNPICLYCKLAEFTYTCFCREQILGSWWETQKQTPNPPIFREQNIQLPFKNLQYMLYSVRMAISCKGSTKSISVPINFTSAGRKTVNGPDEKESSFISDFWTGEPQLEK